MKTKILDAIKLIATDYKGELNFNVETVVEKSPFSKNAVKKTIINIHLIEKL